MKESLFGKAHKALATKILAGIGGLLAAFLSFTLSIYQGRAASEIPRVAPGEVIDAGRWNVTVLDMRNCPTGNAENRNGSLVCR